MSAVIDYFFAPQSPWTFLGHERLCAMAARHGARLRVLPCDLIEVFAASGGLPLAQRPVQRQAYRMVELRRVSEFLAIPLNLRPRYFPVQSDAAARLLIAVERDCGEAAALRVTGAIGHALWCEERNIADAATLGQIVGAAGLDPAALLAASAEADVEQRYQANTREAIERQVFGAPTYIVENEPFWGQDRLEFLERALVRHAS